jgi:iron complex transport system ATP-binding protein
MADPRTPVAELVGVTAGYPGRRTRRQVLRGVDLRLDAGEMVALLGTNGSGKTTLLRVLAGTRAAEAGSVRLFGRRIEDWSRAEVARRVAVLSQSGELPAGFSVSEAVALGRTPHARHWFSADADDVSAVSAALRDADAEELADRSVDELSGGERQRVLVAMALAQEPALLLLDEPTLHLDLAHQLALVRMLERLRHTRSLTVLAVLHDLNLASAWADRAVLLDQGRIVAAAGHGETIDPGVARRVFGVPVEVARTADGRRVLASVASGPSNDPLEK